MPEIIRLGMGISGMDPEFKAIKEAPPACWCGRDMVKRVRHGGQLVLACRGCGKSPQNCKCLERGSTYPEVAPPTTIGAEGPRLTRASQRVAREIADVLERDALGGYKSAKANPSDTHMPVWESELKRWLLLLAPPRKKPIRRSKTSLKSRATVKELDALCREIVFARDRGACRRCGLKRAVDWSHVYSRRYKWLRWDLDNSFAACKGCHLWWHHKPLDGGAWWRNEIGPDRHNALLLRASKPRKVSPELVKAYLEQERKKL